MQADAGRFGRRYSPCIETRLPSTESCDNDFFPNQKVLCFQFKLTPCGNWSFDHGFNEVKGAVRPQDPQSLEG
jgi:hypothetical protein